MRRGLLQKIGGAADERFIFTVKTDNAGTSTDTQFTIPTSTTGITTPFNYDIETSDGQTITGVTGNHTITFPSAGEYEVRISGSFPYIFFNGGGDRRKLLDIKNFGIYALGSTRQNVAFYNCSNMIISATDVGNFGNVTDFLGAWNGCTSLTSFPLINTSNGTTFQNAWFNCLSLTSFPLIDTSSGINFSGAWIFCSSLTSFPLINTSSGTTFITAWLGCSSLTSFPLLDTSSGTNFDRTWASCTSLTSFPANAFDTNIATNYINAFTNTALTTQSIDDILISLDTSGVNNGTFTQSGGQAPSATGEAAIDSLVGKGWTITVTGGYTPPQLLLDEYPNAAAAYSLRELSTASVGSAVVRVRRSSDNVEQDFTATEITDGTLETFVGAGNDGFVTTWYDQSGNNEDVLQATAGKQPQLVSLGVLILNNSKPSCIFNLDFLDSSNFITPNLSVGHTNFMVFEHISQLGNVFDIDAIFSIASGSPNQQRLSQLTISGDTGSPINYSFSTQGATNSISVSFTSGQKLMTGLSKDSDCQLFFNTVLQGVSTNASTSQTGTPFKIRFGNVSWTEQVACNAYITEYILYNSDQSANRTGIETNINTEYSIY